MDCFYKIRDEKRWAELLREAWAESAAKQIDVRYGYSWTREYSEYDLEQAIAMCGGDKFPGLHMHFVFIHRRDHYMPMNLSEKMARGYYIETGMSTISAIEAENGITTVFSFIYLNEDRLEHYVKKYKLTPLR